MQKPQRRGAEIFASQLSHALKRFGHEVRIAYLYPDWGENSLSPENYSTIFQGRESHWLERIPGIHPVLLSRMLDYIKEFQPDIVQVNGARTIKYGAALRYLAKNRNWVLIYRNIGNPQYWVRSFSRRFFYRRLVMPQMEGVVAVSQASLRILQNLYNFTVPMTSIPRGIEPDDLKPDWDPVAIRRQLGTPPTAPVALSIGSLTPEKRIDKLLEIFSMVHAQSPDLHLWIVGEGLLRLQLEQKAETLGISSNVRFTGAVRNVSNYIQCGILLLLTSETEGIPGVVLEAGFLGVPTIAYSVGGVPECIVHQKTGWLVEPDDAQLMANVISNILKSGNIRHIGLQASDWISQNFTMDKIASQYLEFYERMINSRRNAVAQQ